MDVVLFGITAVCALAGGAGVVLSRRPVHAALGLLVVLLSLAVDYLLLGAQFIAVAQVIIYAGAIVVLFVFIIMLLHAHTGEGPRTGALAGTGSVPAVLVLCALLGAGLVVLAVRAGGPAAPMPAPFGTVQALGRALFGAYLLPFEAASLVLLAGMIGAVALGRRLGPDVAGPADVTRGGAAPVARGDPPSDAGRTATRPS